VLDECGSKLKSQQVEEKRVNFAGRAIIEVQAQQQRQKNQI
jgi:hypothetical protein